MEENVPEKFGDILARLQTSLDAATSSDRGKQATCTVNRLDLLAVLSYCAALSPAEKDRRMATGPWKPGARSPL